MKPCTLSFSGHVQVAQVPLRDEPQKAGEINYKYVFEVLAQNGYTDYIGLEYMPQGDTAEGVREFLETFGIELS